MEKSYGKRTLRSIRPPLRIPGQSNGRPSPSVAEELKQDNELYNMLARELEKFYGKAMQLAWQQIETVEMKTVAEQAKTADAK